MAEAVIVDDGGSTRIKLVNPPHKGDMDVLFNMEDLSEKNPKFSGKSLGSQCVIQEVFATIRIVYQEKDGSPNTAPLLVPFPPGSNVLVSSFLNQKILLSQDANNLTITLFGDDVEPVLESRQHNNKRRYIVSNSGAIEKVASVDDKWVEKEVYYDISGANAPTIPPGINKPVHYTSVVVHV